MEEPKEECTGIDVEFNITNLQNYRKSLKTIELFMCFKCFKVIYLAIEAYFHYSLLDFRFVMMKTLCLTSNFMQLTFKIENDHVLMVVLA